MLELGEHRGVHEVSGSVEALEALLGLVHLRDIVDNKLSDNFFLLHLGSSRAPTCIMEYLHIRWNLDVLYRASRLQWFGVEELH